MKETKFNNKTKFEKSKISKNLRKDSDEGIFLFNNKIFNLDKIRARTIYNITKVKEIKIPNKNCQARIRTQRQINLISVILLFTEKKDIKELTIATYTLNKEAISILLQLIDSKKIKKLNLIVASSYTYRDLKHKNYIIDSIKKYKNISLIFANIHFKITLIKQDNNYYQIEGSINYSTNNLAEQFLIDNNEEIYNFDYNLLITELRNKELKSLEIIC